jgi:hypothetical protein
MHIRDYLTTTRLVHEVGARAEQAQFVDYLVSMGTDIAGINFSFHQISSSMVSHQAIKLNGRWHIVWDNMLIQTISNLLHGFGNVLLTRQRMDDPAKEQINLYAADLCRNTFISFFANKLIRYPYATAALAMLGSENIRGTDGLTSDDIAPRVRAAASEFLLHLLKLQKMMMFFHEMSHILYDKNKPLHEARIAGVMQLLGSIGQMQNEDLIYNESAPIALRRSRELDPQSPDNIRKHYADELCCDYQAFFITCRENSHGEGRLIDWKDALGLDVLASNILGSLECNLNIGANCFSHIGEMTDGFLDISKFDGGSLRKYLAKVQPQLMIRKWNTLLSLQAILKEIGPTLGVDAHAYQEQIVDAYSESVTMFNESVLQSFGSLFMAEFIAKIFARASYLRNSRKLSDGGALIYAAHLMGWSSRE